jgi:myosin heavy subunit
MLLLILHSIGIAAMSNVVQLAPIPAEVRERIVQAADALYEQSGHQAIPTVDQVRRAARADMNATSSVMREWRRELTVRAAPVAVQVPDVVAAAHSQALAALWVQAQALANESLQAAQAAWEGERAQLDAIRQELASAYEALAGEVDAAKTQAAAAELAHRQAAERAGAELVELRAELARQLTRTERAEARGDELEHRAADLGEQLARVQDKAASDRRHHDDELASARAALDQARGELASVASQAAADTQRHAEQRKQTAQETHRLAERMTRAEADRDEARTAAAQAREQAAKLQGQVEATQQHVAGLLRAIAAGGSGDASTHNPK